MDKRTPRQRQIDSLRQGKNVDNDFFDRLDMAFTTKKTAKKTGLALVGVWLGLVLLNVAFWGGLIWFVFFLLSHYGVI